MTLQPWIPTHKITITPDKGDATIFLVMLTETYDLQRLDLLAFTREQWKSSANPTATWTQDVDGLWQYHGPPTSIGPVAVEGIAPEQALAIARDADYREAAAFEPEDGDESITGQTPDGRGWTATARALGRMWMIWRLLAARAGRTGEGLDMAVWPEEVTISTVGSPLYHTEYVTIRQDGTVIWHGEQSSSEEAGIVAMSWTTPRS